MWILIISFHILVSRGICGEFSSSKTANNYGPYYIALDNHVSCKGPKSTNMINMLAETFSNENGVAVVYNSTFHIDVRISEIKMHISYINGAQKTELWKYKIAKPCQHFATAISIAKYYPVQNNCIVKKGSYSAFVNFTETCRLFFGDAFFYGTYAVKAIVQASQGNIMCVQYDLTFNKKKPT